ncbi:MAG: tetratricopeptide repeat protein [Gemmataceae bacterium]
MARKKKNQKPATVAKPTIAKVRNALNQGRSQKAFEMVKELYQAQKTATHRELLKEVGDVRSRDLLVERRVDQAADVLLEVGRTTNDPEFIANAAKLITVSGQFAKALGLQQEVEDPVHKRLILCHVLDKALLTGTPAREHVPEEYRDEFDTILAAFAASERGEDEKVGELLKKIGLRSPFLDWKVVLRGLLAYYAGDDQKAIDNWERLNPDRLPFRTVLPLRFSLDAPFATQQPPEVQQRLQQEFDALQGDKIIQGLRVVQANLDQSETLPEAFRAAGKVRPLLREESPEHLARLSQCFYWAIIHHGNPDDLSRFRKTFDPVLDDPHLDRLEAVAMELRGQLEDAHKAWQAFEKSIVGNKSWHDSTKARVRALIWERMGQNAEQVPDAAEMEEVEQFLPFPSSMMPPKPQPLKPGVIECYEKSLEFDPTRASTYRSLYEKHKHNEELAKAVEVAKQWVAQLPDDASATEFLGDALMETGSYREAREAYQKAHQANPLEQSLGWKLADANAYVARTFVEEDNYDEARKAFEAALLYNQRRYTYPILCKWAACEYKAGETEKAEELLARASKEQPSRLAIVFSILIDLIRLKLNKLKTQYNKEFNALLAEKPTGAGAAALASISAGYKHAGVEYYGQKTHEKKVTDYLKKALKETPFTNEELQQVVGGLLLHQKKTLFLDYVAHGQRKFPEDIFFYMAELQYHMENRGRYGSIDFLRVRMLLQKARQLVDKMPRSEEQQRLAGQLGQAEHMLEAMNPFARLFGGLGGMFNPFGDDYDDEEF